MTRGTCLIVSTPEEFEEKSSAFFEKCLEDGTPPTASGLAYALGFSSRQSLHDYKQREEFRSVVERAMLFIECSYEKQMAMGRGDGGIIFALKNFGWTDKQEVTSKNIDMSHEEWLDSLK